MKKTKIDKQAELVTIKRYRYFRLFLYFPSAAKLKYVQFLPIKGEQSSTAETIEYGIMVICHNYDYSDLNSLGTQGY